MAMDNANWSQENAIVPIVDMILANGNNVGIYYFKWTGEGFVKQIIDYGPIGKGKGCGIHFAIADLDHDGRLDIVASGKDGLYIYFNEGY